jgi:hypothetical protein
MLPRTKAIATPTWLTAASRYGGDVSFAQQGPPASAKQIAYIQALMAKAGYDDFRSARTEYRLTPRQARGKFTKSEASAMIDRLTSADDENPTVSAVEEPDTLDSAQALLIRGFKAELLADELLRRGWSVHEPK